MVLTTLLTAVIVLYVILFTTRTILKKWLWGTVYESNEMTVTGKIVLITGCNTGIGKETAYQMARRGAHVVMACRNKNEATKARDEIRKKTNNGSLEIMKLDLASVKSIKDFAQTFKGKHDKLDILINNAGILLPPEKYMETSDGFEIHFGVNHLGHFLLTNLLLDVIKKSTPSRIVNVSSLAHNHGRLDPNDPMMKKADQNSYKLPAFKGLNQLYCNSKLANVLFTMELAEKLHDTGVTTYTLCPGFVITDISRSIDIPKIFYFFNFILVWFFKSPKEGAETVLHCALNRDLTQETGKMYQHCSLWPSSDRRPIPPWEPKMLWDVSERLLGNHCPSFQSS